MKNKMVKTSRRKCSSCAFSSSAGDLSCNYYLDTGKHRNCPVGYCDKYKKGYSIRKFNGKVSICLTED